MASDTRRLERTNGIHLSETRRFRDRWQAGMLEPTNSNKLEKSQRTLKKISLRRKKDLESDKLSLPLSAYTYQNLRIEKIAGFTASVWENVATKWGVGKMDKLSGKMTVFDRSILIPRTCRVEKIASFAGSSPSDLWIYSRRSRGFVVDSRLAEFIHCPLETRDWTERSI